MAAENSEVELRVLTTPEELESIIELDEIVWGELVTPLHLLVAISGNGGLVIGATINNKLVGYTLGFIGLHSAGENSVYKFHSHSLGVHPDYRDQNIGFKLKLAQQRLIENLGIELITWTYNPLESKNAYINITKMGGICRTYKRDVYGIMDDKLNQGIPSDRFVLELWVSSNRVTRKASQKNRIKLDLAHYLSSKALVVNTTKLDPAGWPMPHKDKMDLLDDPDNRPTIVLFEIPPDFQGLRNYSADLTMTWRMYTRVIFELLLAHGYIVSDFVYLPGNKSRSYYVFSHGDALVGGIVK
ncbi:MAG: GNAT family N-acetyltransferase [Chloroflexota bacterium]